MKVLMLNGSPRPHGNTFDALTAVGKELEAEGISYEIFQIGAGTVRDCIDCKKCGENGCVFTDDGVNDFLAKAKEADGFIFGAPVYFAHPDGRILSFMDRLFYANRAPFRFKPGAAVTVARRGGSSASYDCLNKYFGIAEMPVPGSSYWNIVYGREQGEAKLDLEGMQTMRNLGKNMAWLLKCIEAGKKEGLPLPASELGARTNMIR